MDTWPVIYYSSLLTYYRPMSPFIYKKSPYSISLHNTMITMCTVGCNGIYIPTEKKLFPVYLL